MIRIIDDDVRVKMKIMQVHCIIVLEVHGYDSSLKMTRHISCYPRDVKFILIHETSFALFIYFFEPKLCLLVDI